MGRTKTSLILSVFISAAYLVRLLGSLLVIWLTLGWKVRKARRALEKELTNQGMPKRDAKMIGAQYAALKDEAVNALKRSLRI